MEQWKKTPLRMGVMLVASALLAAGGAKGVFARGKPLNRIYEGALVHVGNGTARMLVRVDKAGKPLSVAVLMSPGALSGLPSTLNTETPEGSWEYTLAMPIKGPKTGYTHVVIDWNPHGHPPPHIYTVPHFDFHFYLTSADEVARVVFTGPTDPAARVSDARLVPTGYQVIPETAVNRMGVHAIDTAAPEFHGKRFTATFIYGYYKGQLTFVEPMVTRAYLLKKPHFAGAVKTPGRYSMSGYYPTRYSVRYDAPRKAYLIELGKLKYVKAATGATRSP